MPQKNVASSLLGLKRIFGSLIADVPSFKVLDEEILPYGLNQHTRSICWLAEQVILQNVKKRKTEYGISDFTDPDSDISAWDACMKLTGETEPCFINIKVSDVTKPTRRNDIASVKKLLAFYDENPAAKLFYVVIMLRFDKNTILSQYAPGQLVADLKAGLRAILVGKSRSDLPRGARGWLPMVAET